MKGFVATFLILIITTVSGILWTFHADVSAFDTWKSSHEEMDNRQFFIIQKDLSEIKESQRRIIDHLLRRE